jgi:RHS repeat-associated protein
MLMIVQVTLRVLASGTQNNGTMRTRLRSDPQLVLRSSFCAMPFYTGKERDQESGNDYFDARYYSSAMGRFMSPDWSAQEEPVPYSKLDNPQTLNLYAYVLNNRKRTVCPY